MSEEHLDLLSRLHRDFILPGFGAIAGNLTGVFVFFTGNEAEVHVGAATGL